MLRLDLRCVWLAALVHFVGLPLLAEVDDALLADGWREVTFDGKIANRFTPVDTDGISVESEGSVSLLEKSVTVDLEASPMLAWRWRVTMPAPPTDLATKGEDDRSLALYVAFPFVPEEAGVMERLKRAVVENLAGEEAPGRVLVCVWGGDGARGDRLQSPHLGDSGMMTILRPTNTKPGVWFDETIDVAEDYRKAFASEPPDPMSLAIGADTDDTMSKSRAVITDLAFVERSKAF